MTVKRAPWSGSFTLGVGWALLDAKIGENRSHRHLAHQFSIGVEGPFFVVGDTSRHFGAREAAFIPAGTGHALEPAGSVIRTLYVDPLFVGQANSRDHLIVGLDSTQSGKLLSINSPQAARRWLREWIGHSPQHKIDKRLHAALVGCRNHAKVSELALETGISRERLREIALRDFGLPTAKLLQWLQVVRALEAYGQSRSLADAAAAAGFSDQAHFSRRLVEWFGVAPSLAMAQLSISTAW